MVPSGPGFPATGWPFHTNVQPSGKRAVRLSIVTAVTLSVVSESFFFSGLTSAVTVPGVPHCPRASTVSQNAWLYSRL